MHGSGSFISINGPLSYVLLAGLIFQYHKDLVYMYLKDKYYVGKDTPVCMCMGSACTFVTHSLFT